MIAAGLRPNNASHIQRRRAELPFPTTYTDKAGQLCVWVSLINSPDCLDHHSGRLSGADADGRR